MSLQEQKIMEERYGKEETAKEKKEVKLSSKQKFTLILFAITFVVMIIGFIPWEDFGITLFSKTGILSGAPLGKWYFNESSMWFFIMTIIIAIVNRIGEKETASTFVSGAADMMSVVLIIAVARGVSILMGVTHLDNYIIYNAADALKNVSAGLFAPLSYLLHIVLSILVPSSSGLATLSTPIMGSLANTLGYSVEATIMSIVASNGLVNLITPTCGAIMGGLALAGVEYSTWFKWSLKVVLTIGIFSMIILTLAMVLL